MVVSRSGGRKMAEIETFGRKYGGSDALRDFSREESLAFADLAFLVIMADRNVSEAELETVSDQLLSLAFDSEEEIEREYGGEEETVQDEIAEVLGDEEAVEDFVRRRATRIEGGAHREEALEMLATLAYADGLDPSEEDVCFQVARALGFPSEMVRVTFDEVS